MTSTDIGNWAVAGIFGASALFVAAYSIRGRPWGSPVAVIVMLAVAATGVVTGLGTVRWLAGAALDTPWFAAARAVGLVAVLATSIAKLAIMWRLTGRNGQ